MIKQHCIGSGRDCDRSVIDFLWLIYMLSVKFLMDILPAQNDTYHVNFNPSKDGWPAFGWSRLGTDVVACRVLSELDSQLIGCVVYVLTHAWSMCYSFTTSYTVNIVGGVPQKIPVISRSKEEEVAPQVGRYQGRDLTPSG